MEADVAFRLACIYGVRLPEEGGVMAAASMQPSLNGDTIRDVAKVLPWLASMPEQPDADWLVSGDLAQRSSGEIQDAVSALERSLLAHRKAVSSALSVIAKLKAEIESAAPGALLDPGGAGVEELESAEHYFRNAHDWLRSIREALDGRGGPERYGDGVFDALNRLDRLLGEFIGACQETRWLSMVHDGVAEPTTGEKFTSGSEFVSALNSP